MEQSQVVAVLVQSLQVHHQTVLSKGYDGSSKLPLILTSIQWSNVASLSRELDKSKQRR